QRFIDLLDALAEKYDRVVIDSPPLLPVTDARIIAASADGTILVLRAAKSNRKLSEVSLDGLSAVGAKVLGVVVNDIRRRGSSRYGYYGRYGYGNGSGAGVNRLALAAGDGNNEQKEMAGASASDNGGDARARNRM